MTDQLILKFPKKEVYQREDFYVSSSNQEAYDFMTDHLYVRFWVLVRCN